MKRAEAFSRKRAAWAEADRAKETEAAESMARAEARALRTVAETHGAKARAFTEELVAVRLEVRERLAEAARFDAEADRARRAAQEARARVRLLEHRGRMLELWLAEAEGGGDEVSGGGDRGRTAVVRD